MSQPKVLTLVRHPGKMPDKAYLEHVLKEYPTATGMAVANNGTLSAEAFREAATAETVLSVCEEYKDHPILMTFVHAEGKMMDEDIPPFHILGEDNAKTLVGVLEGDFSKFHQEQGGHTDAFYCFFKYVRPKLKKLEMQFGNDIEKVLAELKDPLVQQEFLGQISTTGSITLLSSTGQFRTFANNPMQFGDAWGWASNKAGYQKAAAAAPEKKRFGVFKSKPVAEAPAEETKPEVEVKPEVPITTPAVSPPPVPEKVTEGPRELIANDPKNPIMLVKAPATLETKGKRKDFYLAWLPFLPQGYKDSPSVQINLNNLRQKVDMKSLPAGIMLKPLEAKSAVAIPKTADQEVARQHVSPTEDKVETKEEPKKDSGYLTAQEKIDVDLWARRLEIGKEFKDNNKPLALDPAELQDLEKRIVKFTEQAGLTGGLKAIIHRLPAIVAAKDEEGIKGLMYSSPDAAADLFNQMALTLAQFYANEAKQGKQDGAPEKPEVQAEENMSSKIKKRFGARG